MIGVAMSVDAHPLALLIPAMSDDEYAKLRDDIAAHGLQQPVVLYEGSVLDGRHRLRACDETGAEPRFETYDGDDPAAHVLSLNVHRRHLSVSQRAMIATDFLPHLEREARERQGTRVDLSPTLGSNDPKVGRGPKATEIAGDLMGVSGVSVRRAKRIAQSNPMLAESVRSADVTVWKAATGLAAGNGTKATRERAKPSLPQADTQRRRQLAEKAKLRIQKTVGTCSALARTPEHLRFDYAITVATPTEIRGWDAAFREANQALRLLRKQLEETQSP